MRTFSISELEQYCDIKAHTLRIWEKRYGSIQPERSAGKIRKYSIEELEKALLLVLLNRQGRRISDLTLLTMEALHAEAARLQAAGAVREKVIGKLLISMHRMDTTRFEAVLDDCFTSWPAGEVVQQVIYPFLQKTGLLFEGNRLIEEHLVVTLLRQKLLVCIEKLQGSAPDGNTAVLFLGGERQLDLFLLCAHHFLKATGYHVVYLGADVTLMNLVEVIPVANPKFLLTYFSRKRALNLEFLSEYLDARLPAGKVFVAEYQNGTKPRQGKPLANIIPLHYEQVFRHLGQIAHA